MTTPSGKRNTMRSMYGVGADPREAPATFTTSNSGFRHHMSGVNSKALAAAQEAHKAGSATPEHHATLAHHHQGIADHYIMQEEDGHALAHTQRATYHKKAAQRGGYKGTLPETYFKAKDILSGAGRDPRATALPSQFGNFSRMPGVNAHKVLTDNGYKYLHHDVKSGVSLYTHHKHGVAVHSDSDPDYVHLHGNVAGTTTGHDKVHHSKLHDYLNEG